MKRFTELLSSLLFILALLAGLIPQATHAQEPRPSSEPTLSEIVDQEEMPEYVTDYLALVEQDIKQAQAASFESTSSCVIHARMDDDSLPASAHRVSIQGGDNVSGNYHYVVKGSGRLPVLGFGTSEYGYIMRYSMYVKSPEVTSFNVTFLGNDGNARSFRTIDIPLEKVDQWVLVEGFAAEASFVVSTMEGAQDIKFDNLRTESCPASEIFAPNLGRDEVQYPQCASGYVGQTLSYGQTKQDVEVRLSVPPGTVQTTSDPRVVCWPRDLRETYSYRTYETLTHPEDRAQTMSVPTAIVMRLPGAPKPWWASRLIAVSNISTSTVAQVMLYEIAPVIALFGMVGVTGWSAYVVQQEAARLYEPKEFAYASGKTFVYQQLALTDLMTTGAYMYRIGEVFGTTEFDRSQALAFLTDKADSNSGFIISTQYLGSKVISQTAAPADVLLKVAKFVLEKEKAATGGEITTIPSEEIGKVILITTQLSNDDPNDDPVPVPGQPQDRRCLDRLNWRSVQFDVDLEIADLPRADRRVMKERLQEWVNARDTYEHPRPDRVFLSGAKVDFYQHPFTDGIFEMRYACVEITTTSGGLRNGWIFWDLEEGENPYPYDY